jgi:hypothetical protein
LIFSEKKLLLQNETNPKIFILMYWTLELASKLEDAPWPATKEELLDYAIRSGAPMEVIENLQEIEDEGEMYESIDDLWPEYPTKEDFFFHEDEY